MRSRLLAGIAVFAAATSFILSPGAGADAAAQSPATAPAATNEAGVNRFYGTISAVDPKAMTFVVDNQTYSIVPETQMTKAADGSPATIANATVGESARGTFTKSADGKLQVTKVRFGRKAGGSGGKSGGKSGGGKKAGATTQPGAE